MICTNIYWGDFNCTGIYKLLYIVLAYLFIFGIASIFYTTVFFSNNEKLVTIIQNNPKVISSCIMIVACIIIIWLIMYVICLSCHIHRSNKILPVKISNHNLSKKNIKVVDAIIIKETD